MNDRTIAGLTAIEKHYGKGATRVLALRNIDLRIEARRITALVGPSGSGKSTLLNLLGLIDIPDAGTVTLFGETAPVEQKAREALRRNAIGFVFQSFNLIATLNAAENIELAMLMTEPRAAARSQRAEAALASVGLSGLGHRFPHQLSGGQQQRVAVARAIVHRPRLLLADEPTANLDRGSGDDVLDLFRALHRENETTVIISSHDPRVAAIADCVVALDNGRLASSGADILMEAIA